MGRITQKKIAYIKLFILFSIIVIIPVILYFTCRETLFNKEWLKRLPELLSDEPFIAIVILTGLQILQVVICFLPGQPIQFVASYMFGTLGGYLISITGAVIGAFISFYLAKALGVDAVKLLFGKDKVENYTRKINCGRGLWMVLLIYLIPGLPKDLVGYVAGISEMHILPFLLVSSIGRTPPMFGSLLIGASFQEKRYGVIVILAILCIGILGACWLRRKKLIAYLDHLEGVDEEGKKPMKTKIAECMNVLGAFCGKRDVASLTKGELRKTYGIEQADVMVLFGGSILCGGDVLAAAIREGIAGHYLIVGGEGHTTQTLRDKVHAEFPQIQTDGLPEAKVFEAYLKGKYGLQVDYLECDSTNCGNNITYMLRTLKENQIFWNSIILTQDATMQHRMEAGLRKQLDHPEEYTIINYAAYQAHVINGENGLAYSEDIYGMWDMDRYLTLLMGEIPRLSDDVNGYGPKGKGFIAHVDIPEEVRKAFEILKSEYEGHVREANSAYASSAC